MKFLKILGWILAALVVLAIVLAFVLPTKHHVEAEHTIDASKTMVYNAINDLKAHEIWSPWKQNDPSMNFKLGEKSVGKGATYSWTSENSGDGSYTITDSDIDSGVKSHVVFKGQGDGNGLLLLTEENGKTKVTWGFDFESGRFMNLMIPFMTPKMKATFKQGLEGVDKMIEARKANNYYGYDVKRIMSEDRHFVTRRQIVDNKRSQQFYASNLGSLFNAVQQAEITMKGKPCGLIYNWNDNKTDLATAIPVEEAMAIDGAVPESIQAGAAITVDYYGEYDGLAKVHAAIQTYLNDRGLSHNWPVIVEYITDPAEETNSDKWLTKVTYTLAEQ